MGYVLSHGAMHKGLNVTYFPSYGAEMRGGTANCSGHPVRQKIASHVASNPDIVVAMNFPSLQKFESVVIEGGTVFLTPPCFRKSPPERIFRLCPCLRWNWPGRAGSERGGNMVMIGTVCAKNRDALPGRDHQGDAGCTQRERKNSSARNQKAIERGFAFGRRGNSLLCRKAR